MPSARQPIRKKGVKPKRSDPWQGVAQLPGGQRTMIWPTRSAALEWAEKAEKAAGNGGTGDRLTVEAIYPLVRKRLGKSERYREEIDRTMRLFIVPRWGGVEVRSYRKAAVQDWVERLQGIGGTDGDEGPRPKDRAPEPVAHPGSCKEQPCRSERLPLAEREANRETHVRRIETEQGAHYPVVGPARAGTVLAHWKTIISQAVEQELLGESPLRGISQPELDEPEGRAMPEDEFLRAIAFLPEWAYAPIYGLPYVGVRIGELNALDDDSETALGRLHVTSTLVEDDHCAFQFKATPKSNRSRTTVYPAHVREVWDEHRRRFPSSPVTLTVTGTRGRETTQVRSWFRTPQGAPICRHRLDRVWKAAQREAGLTTGYRLHDLRHTFASLLLSAGRPPGEVSELLGHARGSKITEKIYGRYLGDWQSAPEAVLERPARHLRLVTDGDADDVAESA